MERFQFATSPDGVRIAVSPLGAGPAVIMIPFWFSYMPAKGVPFAERGKARLKGLREPYRLCEVVPWGPKTTGGSQCC